MSAQLRYSLTQGRGLARVTSSDTYNLPNSKLIEIIENKSIAGIAMITPGTTEASVLFHPLCHRNAMGNVTYIIGNPSDKQNEFGLSKVDIASHRAILYVGQDTTIPPSNTPGVEIDLVHLVGTKFEGMSNIVGATISNITALPFQATDLTGIDILDDDQMNSLKTSPNYEWLSTVRSYIDNQADIDSIVDKVLHGDEDANRTKYFEPNQLDPNVPRLQLAVNGICCTTTSASSDAFPTEVAKLRSFYTSIPSPPTVNSPTDNSTASLVKALSQVIAPNEQGDKEKARMGVTILSLWATKADIDHNAKTVTNLSLPDNAQGFNYVINTALKNQPEALVHLHDKQFYNARQHNPMNVMSHGIKNTHLDKANAVKFLAGDFSITSLADMRLQNSPSSESIGAPFFLPAPTMDASNLAPTMQKQTSINLMTKRVAGMKSLDDIKSMLVHIMTFIGVLVVDVDKTFLHQMMYRILILIHKPSFMDWHDKNGTDFMYSAFRAVEQTLVHVSKHASDLHNVNGTMMAQSNAPPTLDSTHLTDALAVLTTFEFNIANAIANETQLQSQSNVALAYKAMADQVAKDAIPAPKANAAESKPSASSSNEGSKQRKRDPLAGDSRANNKRNKRIVVDTAPRPPRKSAKELGLFLPKEGVPKNKIMPPSFRIDGKEVCVDFASVGSVCTAPFGTCTRLHVTKPNDIGEDNVNTIAKHFIDNDIGKFNPVPFRSVTFPDDLKSVVTG